MSRGTIGDDYRPGSVLQLCLYEALSRDAVMVADPRPLVAGKRPGRGLRVCVGHGHAPASNVRVQVFETDTDVSMGFLIRGIRAFCPRTEGEWTLRRRGRLLPSEGKLSDHVVLCGLRTVALDAFCLPLVKEQGRTCESLSGRLRPTAAEFVPRSVWCDAG